MAKIIGMIQSIPSEVKIRLLPQHFGPNLSHIRQGYSWLNKLLQLIPVNVKHIAWGMNPFSIAQHCRNQKDLNLRVCLASVFDELTCLLSKPCRITSSNVIHAIGHNQQVRFLCKEFIEICNTIGNAPPADSSIDKSHITVREHSQLSHNKLRIPRLKWRCRSLIGCIKSRGNTITTDPNSQRLTRRQS